MHPESGLDVVDLTDLCGDIEIPCDWGESVALMGGASHGPARWVAVRVRCTCGYGAGPRLICEGCKDVLLHPDTVFACAGECGAVYSPARTLVSRIEAIQ